MTDASLLKKVLEALRDLVEDANIDCNETGLSIQAMDASHVALVCLNLDQKAFDKYVCDSSVTLGVNIGSIQKIIKCGESSDILTLQNDSDSSNLKFTFENGSDRHFEFSMSLMDIDSERLAVPDFETTVTIKMPSAELQKICRDLTQFGDTVKITVQKGQVTFSVAGATTKGSLILSSVDLQVPEGSVDDNSKKITKNDVDVELSFALRYLNFFTKAAPLSDNVELVLTADRPLIVRFHLNDGNGKIQYYLAPKVDENDENNE